LLEIDAGAREAVLGRERREEDHVEVGLLDAGVRDRRLGGLCAEIGAAEAFFGEAALLDAGALDDPFVGRVHPVLRAEIVVRHAARRDVEAGARDIRVRHVPNFQNDTIWWISERSATMCASAEFRRIDPADGWPKVCFDRGMLRKV